LIYDGLTPPPVAITSPGASQGSRDVDRALRAVFRGWPPARPEAGWHRRRAGL